MESYRKRLVDRLIREGYIRSEHVKRAFMNVEREKFVPLELATYSYEDTPLPIGHKQTISAPSMIAIMLEASALCPGQRVLEIGTGSGYNACLLAEIVGAENIITIERIQKLADTARSTMAENGYGRIKVIAGDGTLGWGKGAPYDRIIITAAAPSFPHSLIDQLAVGGKILAPIGPLGGTQKLIIGTKRLDGSLEKEFDVPCVFVPLVGEEGFSPKNI